MSTSRFVYRIWCIGLGTFDLTLGLPEHRALLCACGGYLLAYGLEGIGQWLATRDS